MPSATRSCRRRGLQHGIRHEAMSRADGIEIDGEIAHDAFDDFGAQAIIVGQPVAARGREPALRHRLRIGRDGDLVLHKTLRQAADRAGAEAEQHAAPVRCVALEIAPQRAGLERARHASPQAARNDRARSAHSRPRAGSRDRAGLLMTLKAVGQPLFLDLLLMLLEGRHMRIAEHREAVGAQLDTVLDGVEA